MTFRGPNLFWQDDEYDTAVTQHQKLIAKRNKATNKNKKAQLTKKILKSAKDLRALRNQLMPIVKPVYED